ncbi:hypothetical protein JHD50_04655, partial [Sulfurimonas sp. MAG313]
MAGLEGAVSPKKFTHKVSNIPVASTREHLRICMLTPNNIISKTVNNSKIIVVETITGYLTTTSLNVKFYFLDTDATIPEVMVDMGNDFMLHNQELKEEFSLEAILSSSDAPNKKTFEQFYVEVNILGEGDEVLDSAKSSKVTFIDAITKTYFATRTETNDKPMPTGDTYPYSFNGAHPNMNASKKIEIANYIVEHPPSALAKGMFFYKLEDIVKALPDSVTVGQSFDFPTYSKGFNYTKITKAYLGEEVYLVAKTELKSGDKVYFSVNERRNVFNESENDGDYFRPHSLNLLEIQNDDTEIPKSGFEGTVNMYKEAIIKVKLRPQSDDDLKRWQKTYEDKTSMDIAQYLFVQASHDLDDGVKIKKSARIPVIVLVAPWMEIAEGEIGVHENNDPKKVQSYFSSAWGGSTWAYTLDVTLPTRAWCSVFACWVIDETNKKFTKEYAKPLKKQTPER